MAYTVSWIVEDRVIYVSLYGEITLDDFRESSKQIADYLDIAYARANGEIVVGVIDLTAAGLGVLLRSTVSAAQDISNVVDPRHWEAKPGFVLLITQNDVAKLLTSIVIRISKQPMTTVGSLEEALMVVRSMYPELQAQLEAYQASHPADTTG